MADDPWAAFSPQPAPSAQPAAQAPADPWADFKPQAQAGDWKQAPGEDAAAVGRGIINGIPIVGPYVLSGVNKGVAAVRSIQNDRPYSEELKNVEAFGDRIAKENPKSTTGGEIGGAVAGTLPAVAAAPAAFGVGSAALPIRAGASMLTGAGIGGADAAVRSDGDLEATGKGALIGGGLGIAAPVLGAAAGKAVQAITSRASGAEKPLARALASDALTPEQAATRLAELGDAGMIADLGPNLQRQAGVLAGLPGEAQQVVRGAVADRAAAAGTRTAQTADQALGKPVDALATMDDLIAKRSAEAQPLYDAAYAKVMPENGRVTAALKTPAGQKAFANAQVLAENEGIPINVAQPTVRAIDLTKRALDDMVEAAKRAGNGNEARVLGGVRNTLLSGVDAAVPEYAAARASFASHSALQDAFEAGQAAFKNQTTPGQLARTMKGMSEGEQELMQAGARSALADLMGTARNDALKARQVFDQGYNKEKLGLLIGKEPADDLLRSLSNEADFARTRDIVTGNSETFARSSGAKELGPAQATDNGVVRSALNARLGDALAKIGGKVTGGLSDVLRQRRNADLAQILTEVGPDRPGAQRAFAALSRSVKAGDISGEAARRLMNAVVRGGGQRLLESVPSPAAR